jgi:hypothetical protein
VQKQQNGAVGVLSAEIHLVGAVSARAEENTRRILPRQPACTVDTAGIDDDYFLVRFIFCHRIESGTKGNGLIAGRNDHRNHKEHA